MAGLQHLCRKVLVNNTPRLINRNDILLQPNRRRHHLVFEISSFQRRVVFQKSKLLFNKDKQLIYRLASTNINLPKETVSNVKSENLETKDELIQLNSEPGVSASSSNVVIEENLLPPAPIGDITEVPALEFISTGLKEPSLQSLGLGSWWPSGIIQQILEFLHINFDMPWWQTIVAISFVSRIILFPLNVSIRKDNITLMNHLPAVAKFQEKISSAKTYGDFYSVAVISQDMQKYVKENNVNFFGFLKAVFVQGPIFLSVYYGLRGMANLPVESFKTGGLFWFTDLTVPDPYYILPFALSATLLIIIETGAEGNPAAAARSHAVMWFMRALPVILFGVSTRFSACITWYWTISNVILLGQVGILRIPAVARFFNLPKPINHKSSSVSKKGFIEGFKEGYTNAKITGILQDRERLNLVEFQKAGSSAVPRTFKRNPLLEQKNK